MDHRDACTSQHWPAVPTCFFLFSVQIRAKAASRCRTIALRIRANLSQGGWLGKSGAHISSNARLTCLGGSNFFGLLPVLNIGTRSIPLNDVSRSSRSGTARSRNRRYTPSARRTRSSVSPRFPRRQSRSPLVHELCAVFGMMRGLPAPASSVLQRETRIFQPTSIEEITRTIGQSAPGQRGNCVDNAVEVGLLRLGFPETTCVFWTSRW